MRLHLREVAIISSVFGVACAAVAYWLLRPVEAPVTEVAKPLPEAPQMRAEPTVDLAPPRPVKVHRPEAKRKLALPEPVQQDQAQHVTTTARLDADERPYTLTSVLDTNTGASTIYARAEPMPWIGIETRGEIGLSYGLRDGEPMGRLSLRQNFMQIKAARIGGVATLDQDGTWYAGAGVFYRW